MKNFSLRWSVPPRHAEQALPTQTIPKASEQPRLREDRSGKLHLGSPLRCHAQSSSQPLTSQLMPARSKSLHPQAELVKQAGEPQISTHSCGNSGTARRSEESLCSSARTCLDRKVLMLPPGKAHVEGNDTTQSTAKTPRRAQLHLLSVSQQLQQHPNPQKVPPLQAQLVLSAAANAPGRAAREALGKFSSCALQVCSSGLHSHSLPCSPAAAGEELPASSRSPLLEFQKRLSNLKHPRTVPEKSCQDRQVWLPLPARAASHWHLKHWAKSFPPMEKGVLVFQEPIDEISIPPPKFRNSQLPAQTKLATLYLPCNPLM